MLSSIPESSRILHHKLRVQLHTAFHCRPNIVWMDDLQFYILFKSISVIAGRWADDNERLCAVEPCFAVERNSNSGLLDRRASA